MWPEQAGSHNVCRLKNELEATLGMVLSLGVFPLEVIGALKLHNLEVCP